MGSDFERRSYDGTRGYRGVIHQQGRVTLAADFNEAREIEVEAARRALLDVVGVQGSPSGEPGATPTGTPLGASGPGYGLRFGGSPTDLLLGNGVMFVGGERVECDAADGARRYTDQPDWRDQSAAERAWADGTYLVYLSLCEHEVSAWEDGALREVALGGPDTTARARIAQRVMRWDAGALTACDAAFAGFIQAQPAATFDPATMRIESVARLAARYAPSVAASACEPAAQQGYLGAENQLVRLQVVAADTLYWAWDNASTFFKATVRDDATVELQTAPLDAVRTPAPGLFVEVLPCGVALGAEVLGAALTGEPRPVTGYDPSTRRIALAAALPASFTPGATVFLRLFHGSLSLPTSGFVPIGETGLEVQCDGAPFVTGDYWMIALRPETPTAVSPARFGVAQPPDGPRRWVAPLGVVRWSGQTGAVLSDCRQPFDNLVELTRRVNGLDLRVTDLEAEVTKIWSAIETLRMQGGGCCTLSLTPDVLRAAERSIQEILDEAVQAAAGGAVTLCLAPGTYKLSAPLALTNAHDGVTIKGCHGSVRLVAARARGFEQGLLRAKKVSNLTLEGLDFELPYPALGGAAKLAGVEIDRFPDEYQFSDGVHLAIGLRLISARRMTLRGCSFDFEGGFAPSPASKPPRVVAVGVLATGALSGLDVRGSVFAAEPLPRGARRTSFGFFASTSTSSLTGESVPVGGAIKGALVSTLLESASFEGNRFEGLDAAVDVFAHFGPVRVVDNTITRCRAGLLFKAMQAATYSDSLDLAPWPLAKGTLTTFDRAVFDDDALVEGRALLRAYELPDGDIPTQRWTSDAALPESEADEVTVAVRDTVRRAAPRRAASASHTLPPAEARPAQRRGLLRLEASMSALDLQAALSFEPAVEAELRVPGDAPNPPRPAPSFYVAGNDIHVAAEGRPMGCALSILDTPLDGSEAVIVVGNRMRNASRTSPTAVIAMAQRCAVTGNVIFNEHTEEDPGDAAIGRGLRGGGRAGLKRAADHLRVLSESEERVIPPPSPGRRSTDPATPDLVPLDEPHSLVVLSPQMNHVDPGFLPGVALGQHLPVAVTGNVFQGEAAIPSRWDAHNAEP